MPPRMTMARMLKLYKLPDRPETTGFREMRAEDLSDCHRLLRTYLQRFALAPTFSEEELGHWLLPKPGVVCTFVVEKEKGVVTDFISFYALPSTVLGHEVHKDLRAAYQFYTVPGETPLLDLMRDGLVAARDMGFDVFNALNILENEQVLNVSQGRDWFCVRAQLSASCFVSRGVANAWCHNCHSFSLFHPDAQVRHG